MKTKINILPDELELDSVLSSQEEGTASLQICVPSNWNINSNTYTRQTWFSNVRHKVNYVLEKRDVLEGISNQLIKKEDYSSFIYRIRRYIKLADYTKTEEKTVKVYERLLPIIKSFQQNISDVDFDSKHIDNVITWQLEQSMLRNSKRLSSKLLHDLSDPITEYRKARGMPTDTSDDEVVNKLRRLRKHYEQYVMLDEYSQRTLGGARKHFAYSLAAALAMASSVAIAFKAQEIYGNASVYLFIIFVVGYIFKDRFKEIFRAKVYAWMDRGKYQIQSSYVDHIHNKIASSKQLFEFESKPFGKVEDLKGFGVSEEHLDSLSYKFHIKTSKLDATTRVRHLTKINLKHILGKAPRSKVQTHWKHKGKVKSSNVKISYWIYLSLKTSTGIDTYRLIVTNNKIESSKKLEASK